MKRKTIVYAVGAILFCAFGTAASGAAPGKKNAESGRILIAYYSWGGNTRHAAEIIQKATGGILFEIKPKTAYPENYGKCVAQARSDIRAGKRPELASKLADPGKYDIVFVGSPNWCGTMAPPVATFLTSNDLKGKTVIPFFTHGGGGIQNCENDVRKLCPDSVCAKAATFEGSSIRSADSKIGAWVKNVLSVKK